MFGKPFPKSLFSPSINIFLSFIYIYMLISSFKGKSRSQRASIFKALCSACRLSKQNLPATLTEGFNFTLCPPAVVLLQNGTQDQHGVAAQCPDRWVTQPLNPNPSVTWHVGFQTSQKLTAGCEKPLFLTTCWGQLHAIMYVWCSDEHQAARHSFIPWAFIQTLSPGYLQTPAPPFSPWQLPWGPSPPKDNMNPRPGR